MSKTLAVTRRILQQFRHDPRTLVMFALAPCIVLWLFSVLLGSGSYEPRYATVDLPAKFQTALSQQDCTVQDTTAEKAEKLLKDGKVDAVLSMKKEQTLNLWVEGADASRTGACVSTMSEALVHTQKQAKAEAQSQIDGLRTKIESVSFDIPPATLQALPPAMQQALSTAQSMQSQVPDFASIMPISGFEVSYLHGSSSWTSFDFFGPVFIGIFIFVFVFLTASMSLLTERSGGTMERFLMTPIRPWQLVGGYVIGFGLVALLQSAIILWASISLIGFPNEGSLPLVATITVSMAVVSLTLGLLVSGLAHTPFQVIQLMLLFVVPQILLSGIFDLSVTPHWMQVLASCFPIFYGADALRDVMLRGSGFTDIALNLAVLWGFIAVFFSLACLNFAKKKAR